LAIEIDQWLEDLGLSEYAETFAVNHVDFQLLPNLTSDDFKEMGVTSVGHRRKLLDAVVALTAGDSVSASIVDDTSKNEALRRQVTVLFADISGFTTLSSRLDAECAFRAIPTTDSE